MAISGEEEDEGDRRSGDHAVFAGCQRCEEEPRVCLKVGDIFFFLDRAVVEALQVVSM